VHLNVHLNDSPMASATDTTASRLLSGQAGLLSGTASRTQYDSFSARSL
jgi:hypothetical protein